MSRTGRAVYNAMYEPWNLTKEQAAMVSQATEAPSDAPTDREWREHRDATTITADEWKRYAKN